MKKLGIILFCSIFFLLSPEFTPTANGQLVRAFTKAAGKSTARSTARAGSSTYRRAGRAKSTYSTTSKFGTSSRTVPKPIRPTTTRVRYGTNATRARGAITTATTRPTATRRPIRTVTTTGRNQGMKAASQASFGPSESKETKHTDKKRLLELKKHKDYQRTTDIFNSRGTNKVMPPKSWHSGKSDKGGGIKYKDSNNSRNYIRVMPGKPNAKYKTQQQPYVIYQKNGVFYDANGKPVKQTIQNKKLSHQPDTHIPLSKFDSKKMPKGK